MRGGPRGTAVVAGNVAIGQNHVELRLLERGEIGCAGVDGEHVAVESPLRQHGANQLHIGGVVFQVQNAQLHSREPP